METGANSPPAAQLAALYTLPFISGLIFPPNGSQGCSSCRTDDNVWLSDGYSSEMGHNCPQTLKLPQPLPSYARKQCSLYIHRSEKTFRIDERLAG